MSPTAQFLTAAKIHDRITTGMKELPTACPAEDSSVLAVVAFYAPMDMVWAYRNPANPRV